ncbi:MAG: YraN family protein [Flavitalea sp.]
MQNNQIKGREAESIAVEYLLSRNFEILSLNWRAGRFEIDIIAAYENMLHFIEVKGRWGKGFGDPEEAVNHKKFRHMQKASFAYVQQYPQWKNIQYDIIAVEIINGQTSIRFIEDFFCW